MTHQRSEDEGFSADRALIEALAKGLRLDHWPGDLDTLVELGDMENTRILAHRHGTFTFETTSRGQRSIEAAFSSARDARRYMIMDLCGSYRFHARLPPMVMKRLAAGSQLEGGPTGHQLTWPGGEATFHNRDQAVLFSWAIDADPDTIVASYQHVNGQPLFDLGDPGTRLHMARGRPGGRVAQPKVERRHPPSERADRAAIDAMLADHHWERRAPSSSTALVGDRYQGRAISYRQSQFSTQSNNWRRTLPRHQGHVLDPPHGSRRFLLVELGDVVRRRGRDTQSDRTAGSTPHSPSRKDPQDCTWLKDRPGQLPGPRQGAHVRANFQLVPPRPNCGKITTSYPTRTGNRSSTCATMHRHPPASRSALHPRRRVMPVLLVSWSVRGVHWRGGRRRRRYSSPGGELVAVAQQRPTGWQRPRPLGVRPTVTGRKDRSGNISKEVAMRSIRTIAR